MPPHKILLRAAYFIATALSTGCAAHSVNDSSTAPRPMDRTAMADDVQRSIDTTYTRADVGFSVTSTSEVGAELAVPTLRSATETFAALFGQRPPAISVVVIDSSVPLRDLPVTSQTQGRTITLFGSGLGADSTGAAGTRRSFRKTLAVLSAEAWVGAYANAWTSALVREEVILPASQDSTDVPQLPDWLYAGTIHLMANEHAFAQSTATLRTHPAEMFRLNELFSYHLPATSDDDVEEFLSDLSVGTHSPAEFRAEVSPPRRQAAVFLAQSTSVLEYLREVKGVDVGSHLYGALLAGNDMDWVISESLGMSLAELEAGWRRWVLASPVAELL